MWQMDDDNGEGDEDVEESNNGAANATATAAAAAAGPAPSRHHHKFSPDDEAAMEAAVEIAVLLSHSNNKNAQILFNSVLTDNYEKLSATAATIRSEISNQGTL